MSPGDADIPGERTETPFSLCSDLLSKRSGQPLWPSSSGRLTPLSFHGLRYPLSRDSIETSDARDALEEACLKREPVPGEEDWFLRRSRKEEIEEMLPGFRILPKMEPRSLTSSPKVDRVGESVPRGAGAFWSNLESKNGRESSKESDLGRGIAPLTVAASSP